jgi:hypothetical protein
MKVGSVMVVAVVVLASACSDDKEGTTSACADISGNWATTSSRVEGTCPTELDGDGKDTIVFSKTADGGWGVVFTGVVDPCPANLDPATCKLTAQCVLTKDGATIATVNVDYTFTSGAFSGSTSTAAAPPAVPATCSVTYRETGSKL